MARRNCRASLDDTTETHLHYKRSRSYYRKMRAKHIVRKRRISRSWMGHGWFGDNGQDGRYSKNKIHCSCWMCRPRKCEGDALTDVKKKQSMASAIQDGIDEMMLTPNKVSVPGKESRTNRIEVIHHKV